MRAFRSLLIGIGSSALWPVYLGLLAYTARQAPWPRSLAVPAATTLAILALAVLVMGLARWMLRPEGWAEATLQVPAAVTRQFRPGGPGAAHPRCSSALARMAVQPWVDRPRWAAGLGLGTVPVLVPGVRADGLGVRVLPAPRPLAAGPVALADSPSG